MSMASARVIQVSTLFLFVGFLALLGIVVTTLWLAARSQASFEEVLDARAASEGAVELRYALQAAESSQRGYLATGNEIYLAPYRTAQSLVRRQFDALEGLLAPIPERAPLLQRLRTVIDEKIAEMDETIALKRERRDADALAVLRSNRGKALMDEANVFLSSLIRGAGERLTDAVAEQNGNAALLKAVTLSGGALIFLVVGIVIAVMSAYARDIVRARDEVGALNAGLERRVEERTAELKKARDRAETSAGGGEPSRCEQSRARRVDGEPAGEVGRQRNRQAGSRRDAGAHLRRGDDPQAALRDRRREDRPARRISARPARQPRKFAPGRGPRRIADQTTWSP